MAQTLFRKENIKPVEQIKILAQVENQSTREAEKILLTHSKNPSVLKSERVRAITDEKIEIRFVADLELNSKIEQLRGLLAHKHPSNPVRPCYIVLADAELSL